MSADNYVMVSRVFAVDERYGAWHCFMSDEGGHDLGEPMFQDEDRGKVIEWAHRWAAENMCEYGVRVDLSIFDPPAFDDSYDLLAHQLKNALREAGPIYETDRLDALHVDVVARLRKANA